MVTTTRDVQEALVALGYDPGPVDGLDGSATQAAVREFQADAGLSVDGIAGPATRAALDVALTETEEGVPAPTPVPLIIRHAQSLGHQTWGDPWRLWLFGIRAPSRTANKFDDTLGCALVDEAGRWQVHVWPGTTDPGSSYLYEPPNSRGTAILVAGQYLDVWKIDLHGGKYKALCQRAGEVRVYRDNTGDNKLDLDKSTIQPGLFGINIHASTQVAGRTSTEVNRWSAGCQVHASPEGFGKMMQLADEQVEQSGRSTFSYTLMDQWW